MKLTTLLLCVYIYIQLAVYSIGYIYIYIYLNREVGEQNLYTHNNKVVSFIIQSSLSYPALVYPEPLPTGALSDETNFVRSIPTS